MTNTLSTVLFINDNPVGYELSRQQNKVHFTPTQFTAKACCPPRFTVTNNEGAFNFDNTITEELKDQAIHTLEVLQVGNLLG